MNNASQQNLAASLAAILLLAVAPQIRAGVVAHWSFDEDTYDSGNHIFSCSMGTHDATVNISDGKDCDTNDSKFGGGSFVMKRNTCANLDSGITLDCNKGYSIAFWAKLENYQNYNSGVIGKGEKIKAFFSDSSIIFGKLSPTDEKWHHYAIIVDGKGNRKLFQDHIELESSSSNKPSFFLNCLGGTNDLPSHNGHHWNSFKGHLDEVWVFDYALTSNEVTSLNNINAVPEPASLAPLAILLGLAASRRRRDTEPH